jgi:hypothetical protein
MLFVLIVMSIVTLLLCVRFEKIESEAIRDLMPGITFAFSWLVMALLFTVLVETWQYTLSIPEAVREPVPAWGQVIESVLHTAAYLFPVSRMALAVLYTLPLLLVPLLVIIVKRAEVGPALLYSALINLLFFWLLVVLDNGLPETATRIPIQGLVLLLAYALVLFLLVRPQPFALRPI